MTGHTGAVLKLVWGTTLLASAGADNTVRIWDGTTGAIRWTLTGHTAEILVLAWSADGARLASAGKDGVARIWDPHTGAVLALFKHPSTSMVHTSDGEGSVTMEEYLRWAGEQGMPAFAAIDDSSNVIEVLAWSTDGTRDGQVNIWNGQTGERVGVLDHGGDVDLVAWRHDGQRIGSAGSTGLVRLWEAGQMKSFMTLQGHEGPITGMVWSPDDTRLATAGADGTARLWDERGVPLGVLAGHGDAVTGVVWLADGLRLSTASKDGTARLWTEATAAALTTLPAHGWHPLQRALGGPKPHSHVRAGAGQQSAGRSPGDALDLLGVARQRGDRCAMDAVPQPDRAFRAITLDPATRAVCATHTQ